MDLTIDKTYEAPAGDMPSPLDIPAFLVYACNRFQTEYLLRIQVHFVPEPEKEGKKPGKLSHSSPDEDAPSEKQTSENRGHTPSNTIDMILMRDKNNHYTELTVQRRPWLPSSLLLIIGYCLPFHPTLTRLNVRWCPLQSTALYELSKYLRPNGSCITEICLDDSPVQGRNYPVLLSQACGLRVLSLARCELDDDDVCVAAALLQYPLPASKLLAVLDLSMNKIGDRGACAIGKALRTNRSLRRINLSGNRITSVGARSILSALREFPLTREEMFDKRMRMIDYFRYKETVYKEILNEKKPDKPEKVVKGPRARLTLVPPAAPGAAGPVAGPHERALARTLELIGKCKDPFVEDQVVKFGDSTYSIGNTTLSSLNLAYNDLEYGCLPALLDVLKYQNSSMNKPGTGLLHVQVAGNMLPVRCGEYVEIAQLLDPPTEMNRNQAAKRLGGSVRAPRGRVNTDT